MCNEDDKLNNICRSAMLGLLLLLGEIPAVCLYQVAENAVKDKGVRLQGIVFGSFVFIIFAVALISKVLAVKTGDRLADKIKNSGLFRREESNSPPLPYELVRVADFSSELPSYDEAVAANANSMLPPPSYGEAVGMPCSRV